VIADTSSKILKKLTEQETEEGKLPLLLEFYKKLLEIQSTARKHIGTLQPTISAAAINGRLARGEPLVKFEELTINWALLRETFAEVISVFAEYPQLFGEIPDKLKSPNARRLMTKKVAKAWFTGKKLPVTLTEGINDNLVRILIQTTLQPFLNKHALALADLIPKDSWHKNYCPICGGSPDLGYMEKEVGGRWLVCSRCDSEWAYPRLQCPYCSNQEQSSLSFFEDERGLYRLYVCNKCKCYLKVIDLRKTDSEVLLPLERIYTLDLDFQARKKGYHPYST
jgi:FdhE protein